MDIKHGVEAKSSALWQRKIPGAAEHHSHSDTAKYYPASQTTIIKIHPDLTIFDHICVIGKTIRSIKYIQQLASNLCIREASSKAKVGVDVTKPSKDDNTAAVAVSNILHTVTSDSKLRKDATAQGVARVRHCESLLLPEQRLYCDPYAYAMYSSSSSAITQWFGPKL
mmetsp:Transcript_29424/g.62004  ORF Transcript_29424/g.62004 Transcript_29424/m.62004 type:complete len:168 (-) Transcript_29424:349-852(-)|eukprot:CAMPEP_0183727464 /NCGR_PEP_ID=MMETSP0737-20130205/25723_1 /TAXON_ID=385413 /ORGANISM="Thalassiosira miniscula, Strain CCMP1093" /LENGTH=167 /DNA_ID=CAMNT_0025959113 /DNA_START=45 /DNA_END=548 /DNA_ORIENTATION=-